jgi:iron complex transport system permease protein
MPAHWGFILFGAALLYFLVASLLAGTITAFCGPIGFIGIAVPHLARVMFRTSNHLVLIPAVILTGANVMLLSDIIAQLPGIQATLPINSVTALLGIPVVVWMIVKTVNLLRVKNDDETMAVNITGLKVGYSGTHGELGF